MFLFSTKSGIRNAISLSHSDRITKEDIMSHFVSVRKWREVSNELCNTRLETTTTVDVGSFFVRLCGLSVAACFRFKRDNIIDGKCFYLYDEKYTKLGAYQDSGPCQCHPEQTTLDHYSFSGHLGLTGRPEIQIGASTTLVNFPTLYSSLCFIH